MNKFLLITIIFVTVITVPQAQAQQFEHRGIQLFKEGKNAEAVSILSVAVKQKEFKSDAAMWNYLGLAHLATNDFKKGRKALEQAVKLGPGNSVYHSNLAYVYLLFRQTNNARSESKKAIELDPRNVTAYFLRGSASLWELKLSDAEKDADQIMIIDPAYPQGYVLKSNILVIKLGQLVTKGSTVRDEIRFLKEATDILRVGLEKCVNSPNRKLVEEEFESAEAFYDHFSRDKSRPTQPNADPEPGVTPLKILKKPRPGYTDSARQANVQGTITLAVLFGANGQVKHTLLLKRLGNGLDEQAMIAARKIEFEPMMKDGKQFSTVKMIEYSFSIY